MGRRIDSWTRIEGDGVKRKGETITFEIRFLQLSLGEEGKRKWASLLSPNSRGSRGTASW